MCLGPELLMLISTLGGAAAQQHALRKQDGATAAGILRQAAISRQADQRVTDNIRQLEGSTPEAERATANSEFMQALRQASLQDGGSDGFSTPGATSDRFNSGTQVVRKAIGNESKATAGQLARIDAPINQRVREGQQRANTASQLSMLERDSAAQDFLTRLRVASIQPNPWVMAASQLGQGAASSMAKAPPRTKKPKLDTSTVMDAPMMTPGYGDGVRVA